MKKLVATSVALSGLLALAACATIVEGTDQTLSIQSVPSGAACELERSGSQIGVVDPTPGTVRVEKSKEDITVRCFKEGYEPGVAVLSSSFEGMTAGNVIFGGIVGLAVDAGSGAMHDYPTAVTVRLEPEEVDKQ